MTRDMERTDQEQHEQYREWLALETGEIGDFEQRRLDAHVAECEECTAERGAFQRMDSLLAEERISVRGGFRDDVLRDLPAPGWESRVPRFWRLPVAAILLLGAAAGLFLGLHSAQASNGVPLAGAFGAVMDAIATGALAGAGMLWASWRGIGMVLDSAVSPGVTGALLLLVVCIDVLLVTLVVRRGRSGSGGAVVESPFAPPHANRRGRNGADGGS